MIWPYKDCYLEGGQTNEDARRNEKFWNETLAAEDIDVLLSPKVFTNFKHISKDSDKNQTKLNPSDHMIIKGNNLLVLHSLKQRFYGKIKLIYIDPPYNTGGEANIFTYNNSFNHSTWLTFMKNRLEVSKELLTDDGFIAIAIDHNELLYLGTLTDEIFGRENRVAIVSVVHHPAGKTNDKFFATSNEYMLIYAKNKENAKLKKLPMTEKTKKTYNLKQNGSHYKLDKLIRTGETRNARKQDRRNQHYPIYVNPENLSEISLAKKIGFKEIWPKEKGINWIWSHAPDSLAKKLKSGDIVAKLNKNNGITIYIKNWISDYKGRTPKTIWDDKTYNSNEYGSKLLNKIVGSGRFSYPKSVYTILDTIRITTSNDDLILDFFAGSGTTGHATLLLNKKDQGNRTFILVEQLNDHIEVCKERLQKVLQQESMEDSISNFELAENHAVIINKIVQANSKEELVEIWQEMKHRNFLSYQINLEPGGAEIREFNDMSISEQKKNLFECLDKNQLYINYTEIEDESNAISESDKLLNQQFYSN